MLKLRDGIVELYRKATTSIPPDVEEALKNAHSLEDYPPAKEALALILETIRTARQTAGPVCGDTGVPVFHARVPRGLGQGELKKTIYEATALATERVPLRPNAVDVLTGENSGNNTGIGFPIIYFEEAEGDTLRMDLLLKESGCENVGQTYNLPVEELEALADLEGVRKCVVDAVKKARGKGCPPYTLGVGIGASADQVSVLARRQLFRKLNDRSEYPVIAELEARLLDDINQLGIGPQGLGGRTTTLGVKIGINHRHTSSYCVNVSVSCWASRRARLMW